MNDAWDELRDLLAGPPSVFRFDVIRSLIDVQPAATMRAMLREASRGLRRWPTSTRVASADDARTLALLDAPSHPLVRSLQLELYEDGPRPLLALAASPLAARLRSLTLQAGDQVTRAFDPRHFPRLVRLSFNFHFDDSLEDMLALLDRLPDRLRGLALHTHGSGMLPPLVARLEAMGVMARLSDFRPDLMDRDDLERFVRRSRAPVRNLGVQSFTPKILEALYRNGPLASGLRRLRLNGEGLDDDDVARLAGCPHLAGLQELSLTGNPIGGRGIDALGGASFAGGLRRLEIRQVPLGDAGWRRIAALRLPRLSELDLWDTQGGPAGATALARSRGLPRLRTLEAALNPFGDEGAARLLSSTLARRLASLGLILSGGGPASAEALAFHPFPRLRRLDYGGMGPEGFPWVARSGRFPKLEHLDLGSGRIGDEGAAALATSGAFPRLRRLDLQHCEITDAGARSIAEGPSLAGLNELRLGANDIGDAGLRALASSRTLRRLIFLDFWCYDVTEAGSAALAASPVAARLHRIPPSPLRLEGVVDVWKASPMLRPEFRASPTYLYEP